MDFPKFIELMQARGWELIADDPLNPPMVSPGSGPIDWPNECLKPKFKRGFCAVQITFDDIENLSIRSFNGWYFENCSFCYFKSDPPRIQYKMDGYYGELSVCSGGESAYFRYENDIWQCLEGYNSDLYQIGMDIISQYKKLNS